MNGPIEMYQLRPIIDHQLSVELPDCMYMLKNIHHHTLSPRHDRIVNNNSTNQAPIRVENTNIIDQVNRFLQNNQNLPDMAALEMKQQQILEQLAELKQQMDNIREQLNVGGDCRAITKTVRTEETTNFVRTPMENNLEHLPDIVMNANPTNPPYSLELIQKLWQNHVHLSIKSHLHSTVASLNENLTKFVGNLENFTPRTQQLPKVHIRLIWKNVGPHVELMVSHTPILGEVNLLRFLSRANLLNNYEKSPNLYEIDHLLDLSYRLIQTKTKTERMNLLQIVNKSLGKSVWLANCNQISIADVAAYSAIKQTVNNHDINVNLSKWMERCAKC